MERTDEWIPAHNNGAAPIAGNESGIGNAQCSFTRQWLANPPVPFVCHVTFVEGRQQIDPVLSN
jgi:hypothetical protein